MQIAVVVPVHNRKRITLNFLSQMEGIESGGASLDVIVVDDGSTDGTAAAIEEQFPRVTVLHGSGSLWWTGAVNLGVMHASRGGYGTILIINDDLSLDARFLLELLSVARENPDSLVSSVVANRSEDGTERIIAAGFRRVGFLRNIRALYAGELYQPNSREIVSCDLLTGASLLVPVDVFDELGLFDAGNFPHNWADFEFTLRAKLKGYQCLVAFRSAVYTELNRNYPRIYYFESTRWEYLKNLFESRKFNYGFKSIRKIAYLHNPFWLGTLVYAYRLLVLLKSIFFKVFLSNRALIKRVKDRNDTPHKSRERITL